MNLQLIGAGLPRTGTTSVKAAVERLTGGRCYHMFEVFGHGDEHVNLWLRVFDGELDLLDRIFDGYVAAVDWPSSLLWRELAERLPDVPVLLTHRGDADTWWASADRTVWHAMRVQAEDSDRLPFNLAMRSRFHLDLDDPEGIKAAYDRHQAEVRATIEPERLFEHVPGDGWGPLCRALARPEPADDYPHRNTTADFRRNAGWESRDRP